METVGRIIDTVEVMPGWRITIPQTVIKALELSDGDTVGFIVRDGCVQMINMKDQQERVETAKSLFGCIPAEVSDEEAIEERIRKLEKE